MSKDKVILGSALIIVGVVLLFKKLNIIPFEFPDYIFTWPMLLIVIGLAQLAAKDEKTPGLIITAIGVLFLIKEVYHDFNPFSWWPIFLILAGLGIIFRNKKVSSDTYERSSERESSPINSTKLNEINVFSGGEKIINTEGFTGGTTYSIFGGNEINLLNSSLAPGRNIIEVFTIFGGSTFYVPSDWKVRVEVVAIFGGFSDTRRFASTQPANEGRELVIKGFVIFGGGEIKSS